ncbi:MAG: type II secretion system F family protein, partial [Acidimicrobiia bacterium]
MTVLTAIAVGGVLLAVSGFAQPAPSLARTIVHLQRSGRTPSRTADAGRVLPALARALGAHPRFLPSDVQLRLVDRSVERHTAFLVLATLGGLVAPGIALGALQRAGLLGLGWTIPGAGAVAGSVFGPMIVHSATVDAAQRVLADLRYQASAYLDVVTMLLAGNTGYEGALEQAAHAGDGRLFVELRRRMRESGTRGASLTDALRRTGSELGVDELEQVAATAALSASEGAPVARTLAAKCATLRSALASEQET